ncbi:ABC-type transport auxiliary lipoprotein family protein [Roseovarius dicentrarchi]|uniref:ABC-type transport auxiliary lipoprotein family protein n=1 Tax=Roseovarius dicentrarchi TaxID=2250573 RepID=UPI000DEA4CA7|nr:ABC-type transport auxiliary lipoprotein family protein [Roseovarius dicentrarchi]
MTLHMTRRLAMLGAAATLSGCSALSSLNAAATPLDTYDLTPAPGATTGRRSGRTLLVARADAPAGINTDRIMVKPSGAAITYLPEARWADELPSVVQSLLIRSIAGTGRMGYVGTSEGGPVPDYALLTRIDSFQVDIAGEAVTARVDISLTLLRDRDQTVIKTQVFRNQVAAANDEPAAIVAAFQAILDSLLPAMADWVAAT